MQLQKPVPNVSLCKALYLQVFDLGCALIHMGAKIEGLGTRCITVSPAERFKGLDWTVIPDRIEAGTYLQAAAITGSCLTVTPCVTRHMQPVYDMLEEVGCKLTKYVPKTVSRCHVLKSFSETYILVV